MPSTARPTAMSRKKKKSKDKKKGKKPEFTAKTADRHVLYQLAVQDVESEIDFVDETFQTLRGRRASRLREDFCGTGNTSCEWVRRREGNTAIGLDIDQETLDWGLSNNVGCLGEEARGRVRLVNCDVITPPEQARDMDAVLAMNFSYWLFRERETLRTYFREVHRSLKPDGIFFLDHYGGSESMEETVDERDIDGKFTYLWDQARYDPISGDMDCNIHFQFRDGTKMKRAFSYTWRLWTLPEIREILREAGFEKVTVYWEGEDEDGEGNGEFTPAEVGTADPAFVCYITAEK